MTSRMIPAGAIARILLLLTLAAVGLIGLRPLAGQAAPPTGNGLSPVDPVGSPDHTPVFRDKETVSLTTLDLSVFLPVLSLPQRGGNTITIGYYHNAFQWRMETDVLANDWLDSGTGNYYIDNQYTSSMAPTPNSYLPFVGPLQINLPTLTASIEYVGDSGYCTGEICYGFPTFCDANWVFTDWQGNMHSFPFIHTSCNIDIAYYAGEGGGAVEASAGYVQAVGYSDDESSYHFDASNPQDIVITDKSGYQYHFTHFNQPFPQPTYYYDVNTNSENFYFDVSSSMVDPSGNTVSVSTTTSDGGDPEYILTDTMGRQVTITYNGISYHDADGTLQQVSLTELANPILPPGGSESDSWTFPDWNCDFDYANPVDPSFQDPEIDFSQDPAPVGVGYTTYQVVFPAADGPNSQTFTYTFDGLSRLVQAHYPAGGYTRYDYAPSYVYPYGAGNSPFWCTTDESQVTDKYDCSASSGSCGSGGEAHTQFLPSDDPNYQYEMINPVGARTYYSLGYYSFISTATKDASGNLLSSLQNTLTAQNGNTPPLPTSTVETTYTAAGSISKTTNYQYQYISLPPGGGATDYVGFTDNVIEKDEYGFDGALIRSTTNAWNSTGIYGINSDSHIIDHISSSTVTDGSTGATTGTSYGYDSYGNLISKAIGGSDGSATSWTFVRNPSIDPYHRITAIIDGNGNASNYSYSDGSCPADGSPTASTITVTNALAQPTVYSYYTCTGALASVEDSNLQTTLYQYDPIGRPTSTGYPDGGSTTIAYNDAAPFSMTKTVAAGPDPNIVSSTIYDGLGRVIQTQALSDPGGTDYVDTVYDGMGRVASVSNLYRSTSDATYGVTSYTYDALNREVAQTNPDGTTEQWCYSGMAAFSGQENCASHISPGSGSWVDFTDENGNHFERTSDALGRLTSVVEPDAAETDYAYDANDDLVQVTQWGGPYGGGGAETRSFTYDGLSRLLSATNPETGTVTYSYDADGNVTSKIDARGVTVGYCYDALNRITYKFYTGSLNCTNLSAFAASYTYDVSSVPGAQNTVGRLTDERSYAGSTLVSERQPYRYDAMGRLLNENQYTLAGMAASQPYPVAYQYDLAGNLIASTDGITPPQTAYTPPACPGGSGTPAVWPTLTFVRCYDGAGRLLGITANWSDATHPPGLFSGATYTAPGGLAGATLAVPAAGGAALTLERTYDKRLRRTGETDVNGGGS